MSKNLLIFQLIQLKKIMAETKMDYALLGGIAVSIYGEPRMTFDIDVNILMNASEIDTFLKKAAKFGFIPIVSKNFIKKTGVIPMWLKKRRLTGKVDFIIAQNALEYSGMRRARFKKIGNIKLKIVSPEDLLIHKIISNRAKDIEDAKGIMFRQKGKLDLRYVNFWLKKISKANKQPKLPNLFKKLIVSP